MIIKTIIEFIKSKNFLVAYHSVEKDFSININTAENQINHKNNQFIEVFTLQLAIIGITPRHTIELYYNNNTLFKILNVSDPNFLNQLESVLEEYTIWYNNGDN